MLNFDCLVKHFECYLSCLVQTLFSLKVVLFSLKVYIKQSLIWDTFPTSKMELFVTIDIPNVIFCRLMELYTQYYPI